MPTVTELGLASQATASALIVEVTTVLAGTAGSINLTYVNQAGTGGQTTGANPLANSATVGSGGWMPLATGDWGVRSITSVAFTGQGASGVSGVVQFWGLIPLAVGQVVVAGGSTTVNMLGSGFNPYRMGGGAAMGAFAFTVSNTQAMVGDIFVVGDN
jgi:hypothetical protein